MKSSHKVLLFAKEGFPKIVGSDEDDISPSNPAVHTPFLVSIWDLKIFFLVNID